MSGALSYLVDDLRRHAFAAGGAQRVGAEVELIPVDTVTRRPARLDPHAGCDSPATLPVIRAHGQVHGWCEHRSAAAGAPEFRTPDGGRITFEPGGQIEFSAAPAWSLTSLLAFIWIYAETGDTAKIASLAQSIFWYVLPSLVLFVAV